MTRFALLFWVVFLIADFPIVAQTASTTDAQAKSGDARKRFAVDEIKRVVAEVVRASYPELATAKISIKTFRSSSDYFRSQFSISRFLTFRRMHYVVLVNPRVLEKNVPADGIRAIIAHELAHAAYYRRHNRFKLFGLINLESKSFRARFERVADLQAIGLGYGEGLKSYRKWLYRNIPPAKIEDKRRDYFSPEEIDLILAAVKANPAAIDELMKKVPRNSTEIQTAIK